MAVEISGIVEAANDEKVQNPMQQINEAYKACQFGRFHMRLIFVSFFGTVSGFLVSNTTSYLLPVAECDLNMGLLEKGLLNAAPFIGMVFSSVIGGFLTDSFGRIRFLRWGYGGMFVCSILAGSSQTYEILLTAKFFEGLIFSTAVSALVTFISEFCHKDVRDRVMICQCSFVAFAQIISPAMAWAILTQDWKSTFFDGYIVLNTWNFYIYIMSLWSLFACLLYTTLPESPKYLIAKEKYGEAREILIKMYKENTGRPAESYPYNDIWKNVSKEEIVSEKQCTNGFLHQTIVGLHNIKPIFQKPLVLYLAILGCANFLVLAIYNVVRLWFPQLSTIAEHYEMDRDHDLCVLLDQYTTELKMKNETQAEGVCVPKTSGPETYLNSIIVGLVCLIPYCITGALVNKVGKKALYVTAGLINVAVNLGMRWANSKFAVVALFSVDTAISQLLKGLTQAFVVEYFPTSVRSFALSIIMLSGRFGTLSGNIGFPVLLNMGCVVPFYTMSTMMLGITILLMFMPKKKQIN